MLCKGKTYLEFHADSSVQLTLPKTRLPFALMCFVPTLGKYRYLSTSHLSFSKICIRNDYFMTIYIFVLKGDLNEKIVLVCFFFCRVYMVIRVSQLNLPTLEKCRKIASLNMFYKLNHSQVKLTTLNQL